MVLAESVESYRDSQSDMHRWMIPIVGFLMLLLLSIIAGTLGTRGTRSFRVLKYLLLFHVMIQMVRHTPNRTRTHPTAHTTHVPRKLNLTNRSQLFAVLLLATAQWEWAVQLGLTAIFGLFTGITLGVDYLAVVLTN